MEELTVLKEIKMLTKDMIVSSTDKQGNIIYVNDIFCEIAGYTREELIGQPHNIIRHPDMPKVIFYLLWKTIMQGNIIYAFVKNKSKSGDFYWVKAYVKPIVENGQIRQFTSYRKPVNDFAKEYISKLYDALLEYEKTHSLDETLSFVLQYLQDRGLTYEQFIDRLSLGKSVDIVNEIDVAKYKNAHTIYKYHIIDAVKNGNTDITVTKSCECDFGKMCENLKDKPYTTMPQWQTMLKHHEHVHSALKQYVILSKDWDNKQAIKEILDSIQEDTQLIFDNLNFVIDNYKG